MNKITIDNYESFYIDFLDGNLSEMDGLLLQEFLDENPDLRIEEDEIISLEMDDSLKLDFFEKEILKNSDLDTITINLESIEYFLIAQNENLLSEKKSSEVDSFIEGNGYLLGLKKQFLFSYIQPDLSLQFDNKDELKKKTSIVSMWTIYSSIAASIILIFSLSIFNSTEKSLVAKNDSRISHFNSIQKKQISHKTLERFEKKLVKKESQKTLKEEVSLIEIETPSTNYIESDRLEIRDIAQNFDVERIIPKNQSDLIISQKSIQKDDLIAQIVQKTENPIEFITQKLSDLTHREIDFQVFKSTQAISSGFYLKVGSMEVSRTIFK